MISTSLADTIAHADDLEPLLPHVDYLETITKVAVEIRLVDDIPPRVAGSRFGGRPAVPTGFAWPEPANGDCRFLGQINFADIGSEVAGLPSAGLLSMFYTVGDDGDCAWHENKFVTASYWPDAHLCLESALSGATSESESIAVEFKRAINWPRHPGLRVDWPFDEHSEEMDLVAFGLAEHQADDYLLGYPSYCTIDFDPAPSEDWICLLTVSSHDCLGWCWLDGDKLTVFIHKDKLQNRDFSELYCVAG